MASVKVAVRVRPLNKRFVEISTVLSRIGGWCSHYHAPPLNNNELSIVGIQYSLAESDSVSRSTSMSVDCSVVVVVDA